MSTNPPSAAPWVPPASVAEPEIAPARKKINWGWLFYIALWLISLTSLGAFAALYERPTSWAMYARDLLLGLPLMVLGLGGLIVCCCEFWVVAAVIAILEAGAIRYWLTGSFWQ